MKRDLADYMNTIVRDPSKRDSERMFQDIFGIRSAVICDEIPNTPEPINDEDET